MKPSPKYIKQAAVILSALLGITVTAAAMAASAPAPQDSDVGN